MPATRLVELLRDFLTVHRGIETLADTHRARGLRFASVAALIDDDEESVLFRLKELSHAIFREPSGDPPRRPTHREALFDLAVGSLFHESMKLRENVYQREIYGPRVRALASDAGEESKGLFDEFERMLGTLDPAIDEGVREVEALSQRTADQLRLLLGEASDDGVLRFLSEHPEAIAPVFGVTLEVLLEEMAGTVALGFERTGCSYLASGSFVDAAERFERSLREVDGPSRARGLLAYAQGMKAYVVRDYRAAVVGLAAWLEHSTPEASHLALARDVLTSVIGLTKNEQNSDVYDAALALVERLGAPPEGQSAST